MSSSCPTLNTPQPLLKFYSHARTPPLNPSPNLKYDLRNIPNPPKALRDVSDGRSKRLGEHLLAEEMFVKKLGEVEWEIINAMERKVEEWVDKKRDIEADVRVASMTHHVNEEMEIDGAGGRDYRPDDVVQGDVDDSNDDGEHDDESSQTSPHTRPTLRVGCFCALGHHRSVAFVEELARLAWPKGWQIEIVHRDLERKRAGRKREQQKKEWRRIGRR